jgi:hypothetical protein
MLCEINSITALRQIIPIALPSKQPGSLRLSPPGVSIKGSEQSTAAHSSDPSEPDFNPNQRHRELEDRVDTSKR